MNGASLLKATEKLAPLGPEFQEYVQNYISELKDNEYAQDSYRAFKAALKKAPTCSSSFKGLKH